MPDPRVLIAVTVDYELFGNGRGDLVEHILEPTDRLLAFAAGWNLPLTFFIETAELLAFDRAVRANTVGPGIGKAYRDIRAQIARMVREGHDVQLHFHPQWVDARWTPDGWLLGSQSGDLLQFGSERLARELRAGKAFLENICQSEDSDYVCRIFRAGGYHFTRDARIGRLLADLGITADSSIVKGYHRNTVYAQVDHRDLTEIQPPYWLTIDGGQGGAAEGILELPVHARVQRNLSKLNPTRIMSKLRRSPTRPQDAVYQAGAEQSLSGLVSWLLQHQANIWDFCLLGAGELITHYQKAQTQYAEYDLIPLVMIGHTKELVDLHALEKFCTYIEQRSMADWATMRALETAVRQKA